MRPQQQISNWLSGTLAGRADGLPAWKDLAAGNERTAPRNMRARQGAYLADVSTGRFALVILLAACALGLYVSHVYATRQTLSMLEQAKREHLQLTLKVNRLKGAYDQLASPSVIYERARALGLEEDIAFEKAIVWQAPE